MVHYQISTGEAAALEGNHNKCNSKLSLEEIKAHFCCFFSPFLFLKINTFFSPHVDGYIHVIKLLCSAYKVLIKKTLHRRRLRHS